MIRREVGLAAFDKKELNRTRYQELGNQITRDHAEELQLQFTVFQQSLKRFAKKHAKDIQENPEFRNKFIQTCQKVGVDPLIASESRNLSYFSGLLDVGDFYFELAVDLVEICRCTSRENGGLLEIDVATREMEKKLKDRERYYLPVITEEDIEQAIICLSPLGPGLSLIEFGNKKMIRSVSKVFSHDQAVVISAVQIMGYVTTSILMVNFQWPKERADVILKGLLSESILWIDNQAKEHEYWLPSAKYKECIN